MKAKARAGSLTVVGTGIEAVTHITFQARAAIEQADKVLYLVADFATERWVRSLNRSAESIGGLYDNDKPRPVTYFEMTEEILRFVRAGLNVCAVFYGHPGVLSFPGQESIRRARSEGFSARMLPAISSVDCLYADLGIDPGRTGCQLFQAEDFLVHLRKFNCTSPLCLLQIGLIAVPKAPIRPCNRKALKLLSATLMRHYPPSHRVSIYEASQFVVAEPEIRRVRLDALSKARVTPLSTLYVPPIGQAAVNRRMSHLLQEARH